MTGKSFEHRRPWIRDRLEFLVSAFAIDCLTYTVMSNHLHLVLRSRPDVAKEWSDDDVARRWLRIFPYRRNNDGSPAEPEDHEISTITRVEKPLAEVCDLILKASDTFTRDCQLIVVLDHGSVRSDFNNAAFGAIKLDFPVGDCGVLSA